ncbi:hypothetical protein HYFRA_00011145 [Hymenoscyphus fraxineus]|uniref:Glutamate decarboxylase n=1 Tax=Hymenoscyphus fraxineus TaxID=746836 RepID=A0A9N9KZ77_9HELO|nr:hypothetical protein HYFRA_00011145 [Hymenoscyphus fraxineus]
MSLKLYSDYPRPAANRSKELVLGNVRFNHGINGSQEVPAKPSSVSPPALLSKQFPEDYMSPKQAYELLHQELTQDSKPQFNLATFGTTYMEPEVEKLITESLPKNFIDPRAYPATANIERKCVQILANMYHLPTKDPRDIAGASTIGSSEAIMMAVLAMKSNWIKRQEASSSDRIGRPNLIISSVAQVCWKKAARYFDVDLQYVPCSEDRYVLDPVRAVDLVNERTMGICCIFGTTYTGEYEDVKKVNTLLIQRGLDIPIHVDAASGGFVAPFIVPDCEWDFRLEKVVSINVSGHKYGHVYPGIGWALWRSADYLPKDLVFHLSYLGTPQASFTLNFSRGSSHVIAQYYQFIRLGNAGYTHILTDIINVSRHLTAALQDQGFLILSRESGTQGIPLVAFQLDPARKHNFNEFALSDELEKRGWLVPAYHMAEGARHIKLLRVVCRRDFSMALCERFVRDVRGGVRKLERRKSVN